MKCKILQFKTHENGYSKSEFFLKINEKRISYARNHVHVSPPLNTVNKDGLSLNVNGRFKSNTF